MFGNMLIFCSFLHIISSFMPLNKLIKGASHKTFQKVSEIEKKKPTKEKGVSCRRLIFVLANLQAVYKVFSLRVPQPLYLENSLCVLRLFVGWTAAAPKNIRQNQPAPMLCSAPLCRQSVSSLLRNLHLRLLSCRQ